MNWRQNVRPINTTENCVQTRHEKSKDLTILPALTMRIVFFEMDTDA